MVSLQSKFGIMLASIIFSLCMSGCSAWSPGNPSTPESPQGTALTPRPATDSGGDLTPANQVKHDSLLERH
jgi:hypothetical protein